VYDGCGAVVLGNVILVTDDAGNASADGVQVFDTETYTWSRLPNNMTTRRQNCVATLVGNQVVVLGGRNEGLTPLVTAESLVVEGILSAPCLPSFSTMLGRQERKEALENWVAQVTEMSRDFLAKIEIATTSVHKEYVRKKAKLGVWGREQTERLREMSEIWRRTVEDNPEDAMEQIACLEEKLEDSETASTQGRKEGSRFPGLSCPITGQCMNDPVAAADGYVYERSAFERIFKEIPEEQDVISPATGETLPSHQLFPALAFGKLAKKLGNRKHAMPESKYFAH